MFLNTSKQNKDILKRILSLYKLYTKKTIITLTCMLISAGIGIILPLIGKLIIDNGLLVKDINYVIKFSIVGLCLTLFLQLIGLIETKYQAYISSMMHFVLIKKSFIHILCLNIQYFNNTNVTEIMNNINRDVSNVSQVADRSLFFIITESFTIIGGIVGLIIFLNWKLTILILLVIPVRYLIVNFMAKKRVKYFEELMENYKDFAGWYGDSIDGIKEIKLWCLERIKFGQFIKKQRNIIKNKIKLSYMDKFHELSDTVIFELLTYTLYILGAFLIMQDSLTVGGLFAFITYSIHITGPISAIINVGYNFSNVLPSAKRLFKFLDMQVEYTSGSNKIGRIDSKEIQGNIIFDKVSFSYKHGEYVLKDINLKINAGEKIAIIGENGSGKTTLINLILRLYTPNQGSIFLDGININELHLRDYRRLISVVSQDLYLFNTTVKENIALFSNLTENSLYKAARYSGANDFINMLPDRYETKIGRNGANLSGGERQKIALARALTRDSKILILDEATSHYDMESQKYANDFLTKIVNHKTVILITHRQDILEKVDRIILLVKGRITEIRSHEALFATNEIYREIIKK